MIKKLLSIGLLAVGLFAQGTIHPRQIRQAGATTGQVLAWNGSVYAPATVSAGTHAPSHQHGGADEVATATPGANAIPKAGAGGTLAAGWIPDLSSTYALLSHNHAASAITSGQLALARGGTNADLSATGGANQFLKQSTLGGNVTVGAIADADVPDTITLTNLTQITTRNYSDLQNIPATFAPSAHTLADTTGLGSAHTTSGLTAGQVLRASGAATAAFAAIQDGDLPATITRDSEVNVQGTANEITSSGSGVAPILSVASTFDLVSKTSTRPMKRGTLAARPATCTVGDMYWVTDATAGQNVTGCTATNTWSTLGDGAAGGGYSPTENLQIGATYTLVTGDCGKRVVLSHATPTVTVPAATGFSDGCVIQIQPTGGNATLITGVSLTVYRGQTAWITSNASVWRTDYPQFTASASGAVSPVRDTDGVTNFEFDPTISLDYNGTFNAKTAGNFRFEGTNNATGTVTSRLAKLAASNTLTVMALSDTDEPLGVCVSGCGNAGTAVIVFRGNVTVEADNTVAANDWIVVGTTTAGRARSAGTTEPTSGWILGRARTGAAAGSTFTLLLQARKAGGGSGGQSLATADQGLWLDPVCCEAGSNAAVTYTNLTPRFQPWANPFASVTISEAVVWVTVAEAAKNMRIAFFSADCNTKLGESDSFSVATTAEKLVTFATPVVITAPYVYVGILTDATSATVSLQSTFGGTISEKMMALSSATAQVFHGAAVGSLAFGSTCGTRTVLDGFANYRAAIYVRP